MAVCEYCFQDSVWTGVLLAKLINGFLIHSFGVTNFLKLKSLYIQSK